MAGIYIPGMEMPKACIACPFSQYWREPTKFADDALFEKVLLICWRTRSKIQNGANRNDDYPLVPVPPHGRLGDLDELKTAATRRLNASNHGSMAEAYFAAIIDLIDSAAAVFPADKEV